MRCQKVSYATKFEAKAAKRHCQQAAAEGYVWREEKRIYRCPRGCGWHLSSSEHREWTAA